jgi:hypothetical protein
MSDRAKQEKKRGAVHKLWRTTARLAGPKDKEKPRHLSLAVGGRAQPGGPVDYRRTQMFLQPGTAGASSAHAQENSFMTLLLRMLAEANLSEEVRAGKLCPYRLSCVCAHPWLSLCLFCSVLFVSVYVCSVSVLSVCCDVCVCLSVCSVLFCSVCVSVCVSVCLFCVLSVSVCAFTLS